MTPVSDYETKGQVEHTPDGSDWKCIRRGHIAHSVMTVAEMRAAGGQMLCWTRPCRGAPMRLIVVAARGQAVQS